MVRGSNDLMERLLSGETVTCPKCGKGIFRANCKEGFTDYLKCHAFSCDNCDLHIHWTPGDVIVE